MENSLFYTRNNKLLSINSTENNPMFSKEENLSKLSERKIIPEEISKRITSLRFLLMIFVVFIHNNLRIENIIKDALKNGVEPYVYANNVFGQWVQFFISDGIARCAVPLFFMFAAYLQFMKNDSYSTLLKKKTKSLVIPFFLWPLLNIALYVGLKTLALTFVPSIVQNKDSFATSGWGIKEWFHAFFGYENMTEEDRVFGGYLIQFWFIRDLFILILFSPLLKILVKKFPVCFMLAISFFYFSDMRPFFVAAQALFYYSLGLYFAEFDFDFFTFADKIKWKALLPLYLFAWFITWKICGEYSCSYWFMVLLASLIMLKFSKFIIKNDKVFAVSKYFAGYSFWLFAIHMPVLLNCVQSLWRKMLPMTNTFYCMAEYFGVSILIIVIGTGCGILLKKICPPLFRLLNGGR